MHAICNDKSVHVLGTFPRPQNGLCAKYGRCKAVFITALRLHCSCTASALQLWQEINTFVFFVKPRTVLQGAAANRNSCIGIKYTWFSVSRSIFKFAVVSFIFFVVDLKPSAVVENSNKRKESGQQLVF